MTTDAFASSVRSAISEVLFVPSEDVEPQKELIADLGAESIDFLDLIYRLEDVVGRRVTAQNFDTWVSERLKSEGASALTVEMVTDFAREQMATPEAS